MEYKDFLSPLEGSQANPISEIFSFVTCSFVLASSLKRHTILRMKIEHYCYYHPVITIVMFERHLLSLSYKPLTDLPFFVLKSGNSCPLRDRGATLRLGRRRGGGGGHH